MNVQGVLSVAASALYLLLATGCVVHVLASRKRPSAVILWVLTIVYVPWFGALAYLGFGINRVRRRIEARRSNRRLLAPRLRELPRPEKSLRDEADHPSFSGGCPDVYREFFQLLDNLTRAGATAGNRCALMRGGEQVFGAMGAAIDRAKSSIHLETYILDDDEVGRDLLERMAARVADGVEVRVLVDGYGSNLFSPWRVRQLRRGGLELRLLRQFQPFRGRVTINLRNHRKLLIVDGREAFTGGMNISRRHLLDPPGEDGPPAGHGAPVIDYHTHLEGPAVLQLQQVFAEDWFDVTGEDVFTPAYFPRARRVGSDVVRTINSGPDRATPVMLLAFCAAIQTAGRSIRIVTPYFVPDPAILILLQLAAMGGVDTAIVLPRANNFRTVKYAARYLYPELLRAGVRIFEREAPFSHAKLMLIDDTWASVGSANWDMRTFHLQFDTNVGVISPSFARQVGDAIEAEIAASEEITYGGFLPRPPLRGLLERAASLCGDLL